MGPRKSRIGRRSPVSADMSLGPASRNTFAKPERIMLRSPTWSRLVVSVVYAAVVSEGRGEVIGRTHIHAHWTRTTIVLTGTERRAELNISHMFSPHNCQ